MIQGKILQDSSTGWMQIEDDGGIHIAVKGLWNGGTLTIEQRINGTAYAIQSSDDSVIAHTSNFNRHVRFEKHDTFRLTLISSINPSLDYSISGRLGSVLN